MLDHAREAVAMARGKTRADLDCDRQLNLALVRLLEIVGEAAAASLPMNALCIPISPGWKSWACETA
jgi:uncharacterized protein with HEPN domain